MGGASIEKERESALRQIESAGKFVGLRFAYFALAAALWDVFAVLCVALQSCSLGPS